MAEKTQVRFTHLDKLLFPAGGITKKEVIGYYIRVAPLMLPHLADRPLVLNRFPDGVDHEGFYEKDAPAGTPAWVERFTRFSEIAGRDVHYIICNELDTLIWLANLAAIEINIPLSRRQDFDHPDMVFFDLDPEPPKRFADVVAVALALRELLRSIGLESFAKTSGKKGVHIVVPIETGSCGYGETREFAHRIGQEMAKGHDGVVSEFPRSRDPDTIFVDYLQNAPGKTMVAPYSLRARPDATVSLPLAWNELAGARPEDYNMRSVISRREDPWAGIGETRQRLPGA
jgi:bifunctional non-homologous end joining protein LigD